jgi:hypothetical protein
VKDLDPGQQRELDFLLSQRSSWTRFTLAQRILIAGGLAVFAGGLGAVTALMLGGPWLPWAVVGATVMLLVLAAPVFAPEKAARWAVRSQVPTAESMKRGEAAWQRTGQANVPPKPKPKP